ncbi:BNR/Asp-box repeat-containing protein, partial [Pseudomonas savastanoi]
MTPSNPNSSLAAVGVPGKGLLVALNDLREGRFKLSLYSTDEQMKVWRPLPDLDKSPDPLGTPFALEAYKAAIGEGFRASSGAR